MSHTRYDISEAEKAFLERCIPGHISPLGDAFPLTFCLEWSVQIPASMQNWARLKLKAEMPNWYFYSSRLFGRACTRYTIQPITKVGMQSIRNANHGFAQTSNQERNSCSTGSVSKSKMPAFVPEGRELDQEPAKGFTSNSSQNLTQRMAKSKFCIQTQPKIDCRSLCGEKLKQKTLVGAGPCPIYVDSSICH
jgi:hypothetical protein